MGMGVMATHAERVAEAMERSNRAVEASATNAEKFATATNSAAAAMQNAAMPSNVIGGPVTQGLTAPAAGAARAAFHRGGGGSNGSSSSRSNGFVPFGGVNRGGGGISSGGGGGGGRGFAASTGGTPQHLLPGWVSPLPLDPATASAPVTNAVVASGSAVVDEIRQLRNEMKSLLGRRLSDWRARGGD